MTGNFYHAWWTNEKAMNFWIQNHMLMQRINIVKKHFLLGLTNNELERSHDGLILCMVIAAGLLYAQ